jgi:hypothetical protein
MQKHQSLEKIDLRSLTLPFLACDCFGDAYMYGTLSANFQNVCSFLMLISTVLFIVMLIKSRFEVMDIILSRDKIIITTILMSLIALPLHWYLLINVQFVMASIWLVAGCVVLFYWAYLLCRKRIAL